MIFYRRKQVFVIKVGYLFARQGPRTAAARARAVDTRQVLFWLVEDRVGPLAGRDILRSDEITLIAQVINFMHIRRNVGDIGYALVHIMHES